MRPDDRRAGFAGRAGRDGTGADGADAFAREFVLDADLAGLDAELARAGSRARAGLGGRERPARAFASSLRGRLLASMAAPDAGAGIADAPSRPAAAGRSRFRPDLATPGEVWAPSVLTPHISRRTPTVLPRARWALVAAAGLTTVLVAGAIGARVDWLFPAPTDEASAKPSAVVAESLAPLPSSSPVVLGPVPTTEATEAPPTTAEPTDAATPKPTTAPTVKPAATSTPKPEPTKPPVGSMDLLAKACPGGVFLDWTKPSTSVAHYHVLRSLGGDVPPTYPADGAVEVESATSWSATITDGFDASIEGGQTANYRAFAFDGEDNLLAMSPSRTVTTASVGSLGALVAEPAGPGALTVSWTGTDVHAACFSYGKLVVSTDDPAPSYLKGSSALVAVGDTATTSVYLEGLPSGKTVWMRYEFIRATGTGKFVVARSTVIQVTYP